MADIDSRNPPKTEIDSLFNLYDSGNYSGVERFCRQLLNRYPESGLVLNTLGVVLNGQSRESEAIKAYEQAIRAEPGYADSYNNLGLIIKKRGNQEEALQRFKQAVKADPDYVEARNNLGVTLQELDQHEAALEHLEKAANISPNVAFIHFNYAKSLRIQGDLDKALHEYNQAINLKSGYFEAYNNRGNLLEDLHRYEDAKKNYTSAVQLNPNNSLAFSNRGLVEKKLGDYTGAFRDFSKALELENHRPGLSDKDLRFRLNVNLGDILVYFQKFSEAMHAYDAALEIQPGSEDVLAFKGNVICGLGRLEAGLQMRQDGWGFISFDSKEGVTIKHGPTV